MMEIPLDKRLPNKTNHFSLSSSSSPCCNWSITRVAAATTYPSFNPSTTQNRHWMVLMDTPPQGVNSKPQVIDYYVKTLQTVLGSYLSCFVGEIKLTSTLLSYVLVLRYDVIDWVSEN